MISNLVTANEKENFGLADGRIRSSGLHVVHFVARDRSNLTMTEAEKLAESVEKIDISKEAGEVDVADDVDAEEARRKKKALKKKLAKKKKKQTEPPTVGLSKVFPTKKYPEGELCPVNENLKRTTDEELRAKEREESEGYDYLNDLRKAAEVHREVRQYMQSSIRPGMSMTSIAESIESSVQKLAEGQTWKEAGTGFPTGLNANDCAAHWTPNKGDTTVWNEGDVVCVDFGVHVGGRIIDSAFTMSFDPTFKPLLDAVRDATDTGIKEAGIDVRMCDIGAAVQETMESYELPLNGRTYPIKCIQNLQGHNIKPYVIHGGKSVPIVDNGDQTKMEEGETFAIETFGSTGRGYVIHEGETSHYALNKDHPQVPLRLQSAKHLLGVIDDNFGTLPFCRRYLDQLGEDKYLMGLNNLVKSGIVADYPPLMDTKGAYTAQFEHTLVLKPTSKEVLSRGSDY